MPISASQQIDGNYRTVTSNVAFQLESTWTFSPLTTGAAGTHTLFTVTGTCAVNAFGFCTTNLAGNGTLELGFDGGTATMGDQHLATAIDANEVWHEGVLAIGGLVASHIHPTQQDVILTIATDTVTTGVIVFYCQWRPLSSDGRVTVTVPA